MMHNTDGLYQMLKEQLTEVNKQIDSITASSSSPVYGVPANIYELRNTDGTFVMVPLMAAKSQILAGMAQLKASDTFERASKGKGRGW